MKIYFGNTAYRCGEISSTVEELYQKGNIITRPEELRKAGFERNALIRSDQTVYDLIKPVVQEIIKSTKNFAAMFHDSCAPRNQCFPHNSIAPGERIDAQGFMRYVGTKIMSEAGCENVKYYGITQQGCAGIFTAMELSTKFLMCSGKKENYLCLTGDTFPETMYNDRQALSILLSDCASGLVVSSEPMEYEIIDIQNSGNADVKASQLKQLSLITGMLKDVVARNNIDVSEVENVFIQNCWTDFWKAAVKNIFRDDGLAVQDRMKDFGHGQSSDFVINLIAREEKGMVTPGRLQVAIGYGYGLHYSCVVFKKV